MTDQTFQLLKTPDSKKLVILSPRRATRPDIAQGTGSVCPFCPGGESERETLYEVKAPVIPAQAGIQLTREDMDPWSASRDDAWFVRVVANKFPFAHPHEIIIHSPDHHKDIHELPLSQVRLLVDVFHKRFIEHQAKGQVCIFHNRGTQAGESIPHPHSQLAVVPFGTHVDAPALSEKTDRAGVSSVAFDVFAPSLTQWPDEVWIAPKAYGTNFAQIISSELDEFAEVLQTTIRLLDGRHGHEMPYNFSIYSGDNWYVRIIPRQKTLGGFEIATGIFINTQDPEETNEFLKNNWDKGGQEISHEHQAKYHRNA